MTDKEELDNQEEAYEDEGLRKRIAIGLKPHPITGETGIIIKVADQESWLSYPDTLRLIGDLQMIIITGVSATTAMSVLRQTSAPKPTFGV